MTTRTTHIWNPTNSKLCVNFSMLLYFFSIFFWLICKIRVKKLDYWFIIYSDDSLFATLRSWTTLMRNTRQEKWIVKTIHHPLMQWIEDPYAGFNVLDFHTRMTQGRGKINSRSITLWTIGSFRLLERTMRLCQGWKSTEHKKVIHIPFNTWHEIWIWPCEDVLDITWLYLFSEQVILKTNQQMPIAKLFSCKKYLIWDIYCGAVSDPENCQIFDKKSSIFFPSLPWEYKSRSHLECNCLLLGSLQKLFQ